MTALAEFADELWGQTSIHKILSKAMQNGADFKFEASHLEASKPLEEWACYVVDQYRGSFDLMVSLQTQKRLGRDLSPRQLKSALNVLLRTWRKSLEETKPPKCDELDHPVDFGRVREQTDVVGDSIGSVKAGGNADVRPVQVEGKVTRPHDGIYTFICGDEYRVVKFDTYKQNGHQYVYFQYGPDNTKHFAKCGVINNDNRLTIWGSAYYRGDKIRLESVQRASLREAIEHLCGLGAAEQLHAGERYALASSCCFICGRALTVPSSISAGIGPVCAEKWAAHHGL